MPCVGVKTEVTASRGSTALPAAFSQVINLTWFKRKESKTDKRVLLETEGREEDLQLLILQNTGGWTLEGDASEQLEALFRQEQEDKLSDAMADVLELCRERWRQHKRTTRKDVVQHCDSFKDKDRKGLRTLRSLEGKGLLESKAETTDNGTEIALKSTALPHCPRCLRCPVTADASDTSDTNDSGDKKQLNPDYG